MNISLDNISERDFLTKYLEFSNVLLPELQKLTPSEIELLVDFAMLPPKFEHQRFGALAKRKVIEAYKSRGKSTNNLAINSKLYSSIKKGFLKKDLDKVIYLPKHFLHAAKSFREYNKYTITISYVGNTPRGDL